MTLTVITESVLLFISLSWDVYQENIIKFNFSEIYISMIWCRRLNESSRKSERKIEFSQA